MTAIERTAYPRLMADQLRKAELRSYLPSQEELNYLQTQGIQTDKMRLNFLLQLKTYQRLGYFIALEKIPAAIIREMRRVLDFPHRLKLGYPQADTKYRHRQWIRRYLGINEDNKARETWIKNIAEEATQTLNDPAKIINVVLESLVQHHFELPAFSTLDRIVCNIHHRINNAIFRTIKTRLEKAN